jgi:hypothetical protein
MGSRHQGPCNDHFVCVVSLCSFVLPGFLSFFSFAMQRGCESIASFLLTLCTCHPCSLMVILLKLNSLPDAFGMSRAIERTT